MADMEERFVPEDRVSLKVSVHTLPVFHMLTVDDSADIDPITQLLPYTCQHLMVNTSDCMLKPLSQLCQIERDRGDEHVILNITP